MLILAAAAPAEPTGGPPSAGGTEIKISGIAFKPEILRSPPATEVAWTNHDTTRHTVTAGTPDAPGAGLRRVTRQDGRRRSPSPSTRAGAYPFFCRVHPNGMRGEITVA